MDKLTTRLMTFMDFSMHSVCLWGLSLALRWQVFMATEDAVI